MRDLFLGPLLLAILIQTIRTPSAGVLGWTWLTLMAPQKLIWGFLSSMPLNLILAIVTLATVVTTRDKRKLPINTVTIIWLLFIGVITMTTVFALSPKISWEIWDRAIKIMVLGFLIPVLMMTQRRIHAMIWMAAICLGYFGVKGGLFTLITGSGSHVLGPPSTQIADNNNLALALVMSLPLMNYLRLRTGSVLARTGLLFAMVTTTFGVMGTNSRGGFIGLGVMAAYLWWKSSRRFALLLGTLAVVVPAYLFMPASWYERMGTLKDVSAQTTFQTRYDAWMVNLNIALARPFTGGGFASSEDGNVYRVYSYGKSFYLDPKTGETGGHAAHSVYFQVLGDHGLLGFGVYFALLFSTLFLLRRIRKKARTIPAMTWAADLVAMIQVSFLAFFVSGAALSMAYYDMVYIYIGIALTLDQMLKDHKNNPAEAEASATAVAQARSGRKWRAPAHAV
ncbi:MAG TPA: putative O-glycosylation ligase, exosortase A system-associated [Rhizomicrobium sp.]|nr:putative O-glycosylation ligase, exosortase A system-associated [Rhizomicrobium sp.]